MLHRIGEAVDEGDGGTPLVHGVGAEQSTAQQLAQSELCPTGRLDGVQNFQLHRWIFVEERIEDVQHRQAQIEGLSFVQHGQQQNGQRRSRGFQGSFHSAKVFLIYLIAADQFSNRV